MDILSKIEDNSDSSQYLYFRPFIKGTNIEIRKVLYELSQGKSHQEIISEQPEITQAHILTCLEYAATLVGATEFKKAISAINAINKKMNRFDNALDKLANNWTKYFPNLDIDNKDDAQK